MSIALLTKHIGGMITRAQTPPPDPDALPDMGEEFVEGPAVSDMPGGTPSLQEVEEEQLALPLQEEKPTPMPKVEKVRNWNMTIVSMGGFNMYFSYQTMVAFETPDGKKVVHRNDWGPTTGKHLNYIDGGALNTRVDDAEFVRQWSGIAGKFL